MPRRRSGTQGENATLLRQWAMLMAIPREPAMRTVQDIQLRLRDEGHDIDVRTIQRDLNRLSGIFGFTCQADTGGRTQHWFFPKAFRTISVPEMPAVAALALLVARDQSNGLIPPVVVSLLKPYFHTADEVLDREIQKGLNTWKDRVRIVRPGPAVRLPEVRDEILQAVYDALLKGRQLSVSYRARGASEAKDQLLHPLGLVSKSGMLYLVALTWNYDSPRQYALHRIESAAVMTDEARRPPEFNLDDYAGREFGYPVGNKKIRLRMLMDEGVAQYVIECPLAEDQSVIETEDGVEIRATVDDTAELRWWLRSYGDEVEVLAPVKLRREMAANSRSVAEIYAS